MAVSFLSAGYLPRYKRGMNSSLVEFSAPPPPPPPPPPQKNISECQFIERFRTMSHPPCWGLKPILWEWNLFLKLTVSFVPMNF